MALGVRYVELETIRREVAAKLAERSTANLRLLTPAQQAKLPALEQALVLQPLAAEADCAGLTEPVQPPPLTGGRPLFLLDRTSGPPFCLEPAPPLAVSVYLNLTREQSAAMTAVASDFQRWLTARTFVVERLRREAAALTNAETLDPAAIGARYAEIETMAKEDRREKEKAAARMRALLTDGQKDRLRQVAAAVALVPEATQAACDGFIEQIPRSGIYATGSGLFLGFPSFFCGF